MSKDCRPVFFPNCPFYILPDNPLTAETSVNHCSRCATRGHDRFQGLRDDFRQLAYLTILEEEPKYNPEHASGASFITFIKARVCYRLWSERRKEAKYLPFSEDEASETDGCTPNPLVSALIAGACASESIEDEVCEKIEVEQLRSLLPRMHAVLSEKERQVIGLKFFKDSSGRDIARQLSVSEGRVSQLTKSALSKLKKALSKLQAEPFEEYSPRAFFKKGLKFFK